MSHQYCRRDAQESGTRRERAICRNGSPLERHPVGRSEKIRATVTYCGVLSFVMDILLRIETAEALRLSRFYFTSKESWVVFMKRLVCLLLAFFMMLGLAACSNGKSAASPTPVPTPGSAFGEGKSILRVAMQCDDAPYSWTQQDDSHGAVPISGGSGYACGYDVMMARLIAEKLGLELQVMKLDRESQVAALQSGTVDCVICNQFITGELQKSVDFSAPYFYAHAVTLTKSNSKYASAAGTADLAGASCTSVAGTVWYDGCLAQIPDAKIQPAEGAAPALLIALDSNRVKLVVIDHPTAMAACLAYPEMKLLDFSGSENDFKVSDEAVNTGISVQKGNKALLDGINGVLVTLTGEDFDTMMQEAVSNYGVQSFLLEVISFG